MSQSKQRHPVTPKAPVAAFDGIKDDSINALGALYQGEKTDASSVLNTAMAMMGVAVAYLVAAVPFVKTLSEGPLPWLFVLMLPVPLWLIVAFHSLLTLTALSHGTSVRIIEDALFKKSGLAIGLPDHEARHLRELVGSAGGDAIMDVKRAKPVHRITSYVVYSGVASLVILFTLYALFTGAALVQKNGPWITVWIASVVYALLLALVGRSWLVGFAKLEDDRRHVPAM